MSMEEPAKRFKAASLLEDILSPEILKNIDNKLQYESYAQTKPFPYHYVTNAFCPTFLQGVREEIKTHAKVNFKESDLFRVYQSMDLANLHGDDDNDSNNNDDDHQEEKKDQNGAAVAHQPNNDDTPTLQPPQKIHPKDVPHVYKLRQVLYSSEFRQKMETWTGLPPGTITDQVDCAANCHIQGCHLLCHDDVIGTRIVSYIIYLTDDDPAWSAEEGGALELYDSTEISASGGSCGEKEQGDLVGYRVPDAIPSATALPIFNSMAFFQVQPGFSFHAVQEVLGERPRLSLQGWFHAATPPANMELATLQRLKIKEEGGSEEVPFTPFGNGDKQDKEPCANEESKNIELSEADRTYLSKYLNSTYLSQEAMQEIVIQFEQDSSVQLRNFLSLEWEDKIRIVSAGQDQAVDSPKKLGIDLDSYRFGVDQEWNLVGPAHQQRFLEYTPSTESKKDEASSPSIGSLLHDLKVNLFQSDPFARYLNLLTGLGTPLGYRGRTRRFRRGLDYTVAHYGILTKTSVLDATLCFCADRAPVQLDNKADQDEADKEVEMQWDSGDVGGFECYVAADDEDAALAADEYNEEDDTELLSVAPSNNTLSLVFRDPGTMRFIKYVSAAAPSSRWDISMEYEVAAQEGFYEDVPEGDDDDDDDEDAAIVED